MRLAFHTCDVFTETRFAGNPLAIVEDADGLSTAQMQTIAREFNLSETIFVQTPDDPGHTARVRIFFPTAEIPFAGHPTIGCAIHLALRDAPDGDFRKRITLEEAAGLVPVDVIRKDGRIQAEFTAPVVPHRATVGRTPETGALARALGIQPGQIGFDGHEPGVFEGGPRFLFVPVSVDALSQARPHEPHWSAAMDAAEVDSAYLYAPEARGGYVARMFSPTAGIPEDPATGSASAILAAQLLACGALADGETRVALRQGVHMGRPSDILMTAIVSAGRLSQVRIAGSAVPVSSGHITP